MHSAFTSRATPLTLCRALPAPLRRVPRRARGRMRWLDACTVLLDPNAEAAADYAASEHAPPPPGFGLARPYAAVAPAQQQVADDGGGCGEARAGEEGAAREAADEPRRMLKKRRRRESDAAAALRAQRGDEAER